MNIDQLESYNLSDAVKFHDRLNPLLWDQREHLKPEIREHLLKIAEDFSEFLGVDASSLKDITVSGSNAAYNYTPSSDIDLHLVVEFPSDSEVYRELFDAKKTIYNSEHNITVKGIPVELYAQATDQVHHSQGIYSLLNNEWVQIPRRRKADIDDVSVQSKFDDFERRTQEAIKSNSAEAIDHLLKKIRAMRQSGLDAHGEFGVENLTFKLLRNSGTIETLRDVRRQLRDQELSLKERTVKESVTYGFGQDYLAEVEITPDGTNPTTAQFTNETNKEHQLSDTEIIQDFVDFCAKSLNLESGVKLKIKRDPQWSVRNKTFGRYDNNRGTLEVAVGQRHIMDVLRTIAHELVHQRQHETKVVPPDAGADGSEFENEANAAAGVLMRLYGKKHPELFSYINLKEDAHNPWIGIGFSIRSDDLWPAKMFESIDPDKSTQFNSWVKQCQQSLPTPDKNKKCILAMPNQTANGITIFYGIAEYINETPTEYILKIASGEHRYSKNNQLLFASQKDFDNFKLMLKLKFSDDTIDIKKMPVMETTLKENGYIPTAAEAHDPRFEMALSVDVHPGATGKAANAFLLNTDRQGHPQPMRTDGVVDRMFEEYKRFKK